jgi:uroporphyrinogen decarboxylase
LVVFDSQASPELLSPNMYEEFVLPITQDLVKWCATQGVRDLPLIIGGNTTPIAELLAESGANNLLCDFTADFDEWAEVCEDHGRSFRRNISPRLIETGSPEEVYDVAAREVARGKDIPGYILGTAVVPFGSPTANLLAIKQACIDSASA